MVSWVRSPDAEPNFVPWWCNGNTTDFDSVVLGSNPSRGAKQCLFRSMDRIRCYERRDGGSIPSRGAKYGDSSGLRSSLARKMSTRVRFPGSPPKYGTVSRIGIAAAVLKTEGSERGV